MNRKNDEKLIVLSGGMNSRLISLLVCIVMFVFLILIARSIYSLVVFPNATVQIGNLTLRTPQITCLRIPTLRDEMQMKRYNQSHNNKDLPRNCHVSQNTVFPNPLTLGLFALIPLFFIMFFFPYKRITFQNGNLNVYNGNVFFYSFKKIPVETINTIRIFPKQIKGLLFSYPVAYLEIQNSEQNVEFDTRIGISKAQSVNKIVDSLFNKLKRDFLSINPKVKISNECEAQPAG